MNLADYDNNVRKLYNKINQLQRDNSKELLSSCEEFVKISYQNGDEALCGLAFYLLAESCIIKNTEQSRFKNAIICAIELLQKSHEDVLIGKSYNLLAINALVFGDRMTALDYLISAKEYCESDNNKKLLDEDNGIIDEYDLSCLEQNYANFSKINNSEESSLETNSDMQKDALLGSILANTAALYAGLEEYDEALTCIKKAIILIKNSFCSRNFLNNLMTSYCEEANLYMRRDNSVKNAMQAYDNAIMLYKKYPEWVDYANYIPVEIISIKRYFYSGDMDSFRKATDKFFKSLTAGSIIIDFIEDIFEMGNFLLKNKEMDYLFHLLSALDELYPTIKVPNIQLQIVTLMVEFYRTSRQKGHQNKFLSLYYDLEKDYSESLKESFKSSISVRQSFEHMKHERTQILKENEKLTQLATFDQLTTLLNRYSFNDLANQAFEDAFNNRYLLGFEILDIDNFKEYNDFFGHQAGDICLQKVAGEIKALCEDDERTSCCRYGGDEFLILYRNMTNDEVIGFAAKLRERILALGIKHGDLMEKKLLTVSQGIRNSIPAPKNKLWDYMYAADNALYLVKRRKKGEINLLNKAPISDTAIKESIFS